MPYDERDRLKTFREEDLARWKNESEREKLRDRGLRKLGRSDEQVKAFLEKSGISARVLEEEIERSDKRSEEVRRELLENMPPPPARTGRKDRFILEKIAALGSFSSTTILYPPAEDGWGNSEECGFNLALGEVNLSKTVKGDGFGWGAKGIATEYCTLLFAYFPPAAGELEIEPHVDCQGSVFIQANDELWTNTWAEARLKLHFDLFQHYWDGEITREVLDEHRTDSLDIYDIDDHVVLSKSLSVSANDVVWIKITVSLRVHAQSSSAFVACDFREGADRRIRVEHIIARLRTDRPVVTGEGRFVR